LQISHKSTKNVFQHLILVFYIFFYRSIMHITWMSRMKKYPSQLLMLPCHS